MHAPRTQSPHSIGLSLDKVLECMCDPEADAETNAVLSKDRSRPEDQVCSFTTIRILELMKIQVRI
jgi:hypothetical protein